MDEFEKELRSEFLAEAGQLIADAEQCFLHLERDPSNHDTLEKIFRLAHSLKGGAGAVGFTDVAMFAHRFESLLLKIKRRELVADPATINLMLRCSDYLASQIANLAAGREIPLDHTLLDEIDARLAQASGGPPPSPVSSPVSAAPEERAGAVDSEGSVPPSPESMLPSPEIDGGEEGGKAVAVEIAVALPQRSLNADGLDFSPLGKGKGGGPAVRQEEDSIRIRAAKVDKILDTVGELVILQTVLEQNKMVIPSRFVQTTIGQLTKLTREIQSAAMSLRLVPMKPLFQKLQRVIRDVSQQVGKEVELSMSGLDLEIDKTLVDKLGDPLIHIVRNAVDHGIDAKQERLDLGKRATGKITVTASQRGRRLIVEVKDDGKGLNADYIVQKAIEKGILSSAQRITRSQAYQLIFLPGFSTRNHVTDISGRGVGMDIVKNNVEELGGEIQIETEIGQGTTFRILLPIAVGIMDGMVVRAGKDRYVIPMSNISESLQPQKKDVYTFQGTGEMLSLRGETLALHHLTSLLGRPHHVDATTDEAIALIVREPHRSFAVLVDDVLGQQQVVVKRVGNELARIPGLTGGAILGDGRAALILDLHELFEPRRGEVSA